MTELAYMTGCSSNGNVINDRVYQTVSEDMDDSGYNAQEQESENDTKSEPSKENETSKSQAQVTASAEDLEKEIAAYRAEREKGESSLGNYTIAQLPSEENYKYGIGSSNSYTDRFDDRELNLAFKVADAYVKETLKLESEAWECIAVRMTDFWHFYTGNEIYRIFGFSISCMSWSIVVSLILSVGFLATGLAALYVDRIRGLSR